MQFVQSSFRINTTSLVALFLRTKLISFLDKVHPHFAIAEHYPCSARLLLSTIILADVLTCAYVSLIHRHRLKNCCLTSACGSMDTAMQNNPATPDSMEATTDSKRIPNDLCAV